MFRPQFFSAFGMTFTLFFAFAFSVPVFAQTSTTAIITRNLSLGTSGPQVLTLQKLLNTDTETQVASSGAGSPGAETNYFGPLTKAAVMRFQQKYANSVLVPVGLRAPNGFVGFYTRTKLSSISLSAKTQPSAPTTQSSTSTIAPGAPTNPNRVSSETFLNDVTKEAIAQGLPPIAIATIRNKIIQTAATTTDLNATFLKKLPKYNTGQTVSVTSFSSALVALRQTITNFFTPQYAFAGMGTSFGGDLIAAELICNEESQYLIEILDFGPSHAVFLTYTPGSEAFSAWNIPYTAQILGSYINGAGVCIIGQCPYCYNFPTSGLISPQVGSTPAP